MTENQQSNDENGNKSSSNSENSNRDDASQVEGMENGTDEKQSTQHERDKSEHQSEYDDYPEQQEFDTAIDASAAVSVIVGKWAMPTTVLLVLITCVSGYYLEEAKFTPVIGMIAPVVMALIMVIREASVGKDKDTTLMNAESERNERMHQYGHEKEVRLAKMVSNERIKSRELEEQARQFDMFHQSTREILELVRETNNRVANQFEKPQSTELNIGDTKIKIGTQSTEIEASDPEKLKSNQIV